MNGVLVRLSIWNTTPKPLKGPCTKSYPVWNALICSCRTYAVNATGVERVRVSILSGKRKDIKNVINIAFELLKKTGDRNDPRVLKLFFLQNLKSIGPPRSEPRVSAGRRGLEVAAGR